ncbi:MAG: acyl carrier protein [bacterium]|nr:acyl carrier protein [bacterium]
MSTAAHEYQLGVPMTGGGGDALRGEGIAVSTLEETMGRVRGALSRITQKPAEEIDLEVSFEELRLSSIEGLTLLGDLELSLGVEIEPSEVFEHATLREFCKVLVERSGEQ